MTDDKKRIKYKISVAFLAQSVERAALNRAVVGSRPTGGVLFYTYYREEKTGKRRRKERGVRAQQKKNNKEIKRGKSKKSRFRLGSNQGPIG